MRREVFATAAGAGRSSSAPWKVIVLSTFGTALEFYDFIIYGVFASYISTQFFPSDSALSSLLKTFAVFAIGYLARPLGGVVLAHFGDRFGRRGVFLFSLLAVSFSTIGMAVMPTYATWGVAASVIFVLLRVLQGLCFGGEIAGAMTYVVEVLPRRAGLSCSLIFALAGLGVVMASLVNTGLQSHLSPAAMTDYGWRIAFGIGGLFGLVAFWIRGSLAESPAFLELKARIPRAPIAVVLQNYGRATLIGMALTAPLAAMNGLLFAHMPGYLITVLHYSPKAVAPAILSGIVSQSIFVVVYGWLSDSITRIRLHRLGSALLLLGAWPFYTAVVDHQFGLVSIFVAVGLASGLVNGTVGALLADLYRTPVRFTGIAFSYNVCNAFFQGLAPLAATLLIEATGSTVSPSLFLGFAALIGVAGGLVFGRFGGKILAAPAASPTRAPKNLDNVELIDRVAT